MSLVYQLGYDLNHHDLTIDLTAMGKAVVMESEWWWPLHVSGSQPGRFDPPNGRTWGYVRSLYSEDQPQLDGGMSLRCPLPEVDRRSTQKVVRRLASLRVLFDQLNRAEPEQLLSVRLWESHRTWMIGAVLSATARGAMSNHLFDLPAHTIGETLITAVGYMRQRITPSRSDIRFDWSEEGLNFGYVQGPILAPQLDETPGTGECRLQAWSDNPILILGLLAGLFRLTGSLYRIQSQRVA